MPRYLFFFLLLAAGVRAQAPQVLRGRVVDAETHQPIPHAQVGVAGNRLGTSTNDDGRFALSIPAAYAREQLTVALLGYRSYAQALPPLPGPELRIELRLSPAALGEVQVTGSVLGLVREAVARIPRNYPARPTTLTGFYRESDNDSLGRPRYLVEGLLKVRKAPYQRRTATGDVQSEQARQVDLRLHAGPFFDWAGGLFIAHRADFVHRRAQFIDPRYFRQYEYTLAPGTSYQGRPVYVVDFAPRPGSRRAYFAGRLYIDQETYAFLEADWHYTAAGLAHDADPADSRTLRVAFQPYAGRWHLQRVWWQTRYRPRPGPALHYFGEFLTTAIDTAQAPPPTYAERAHYRDAFLHHAGPYDSAFWQGRTTLLPTESLRRALDQARQARADSLFQPTAPAADALATSAWQRLLGCLSYGGAVGVLPLRVAAGTVHVAFAPAGSSFRATSTEHVAVPALGGWWSGEYAFDLGAGLALRLATRGVFGQFGGSGLEAGLSYQRNLRPRHRPLYGRAGLHYTRQAVAYELGTFANPDAGLRVGGSRLEADAVSLRLQTSTAAVQPKLGLGLELSRQLELVADAGYLLPLSTRPQLVAQEESGFFLTRRSGTVRLPSADVALRVDNQPAPAPPWQPGRWLFSFGLLFRVR